MTFCKVFIHFGAITFILLGVYSFKSIFKVIINKFIKVLCNLPCVFFTNYGCWKGVVKISICYSRCQRFNSAFKWRKFSDSFIIFVIIYYFVVINIEINISMNLLSIPEIGVAWPLFFSANIFRTSLTLNPSIEAVNCYIKLTNKFITVAV